MSTSVNKSKRQSNGNNLISAIKKASPKNALLMAESAESADSAIPNKSESLVEVKTIEDRKSTEQTGLFRYVDDPKRKKLLQDTVDAITQYQMAKHPNTRDSNLILDEVHSLVNDHHFEDSLNEGEMCCVNLLTILAHPKIHEAIKDSGMNANLIPDIIVLADRLRSFFNTLLQPLWKTDLLKYDIQVCYDKYSNEELMKIYTDAKARIEAIEKGMTVRYFE